jgi:hypothetical protein
MIRSGPIAKAPRASASRRRLAAARWICFGLFLAALAWVTAETLRAKPEPAHSNWPHALLLIAAAASTLVSLSRELPGQNVLLAAVVIGGLGSLLQAAGGWAALPISPRLTNPAGHGPHILFAWWIPLVWIVTLLNSRGAARLILRPARQTPTYGFRLLALTAALSLLFVAGLETFAVNVGGSWLLDHSRAGWIWRGIPPAHFLAFPLAAVIILALATPALINKRPVEFPPDYQPLITWTLLNLLFAIGAAGHQLWTATGVSAGAALIVAVAGLRGTNRAPATARRSSAPDMEQNM